MTSKSGFVGINIQFPISRLILDGKKTIETRTYPLPKDYVGKKLVIVETPGPAGEFKARLVGLVTFGESFEYKNEASFYRDEPKHCVSRESPWCWVGGKNKWGWPIISVTPLPKIKPAPEKKGIRYTRGLLI